MSFEAFHDQYASPAQDLCDWASGRAPTPTSRHPAGSAGPQLPGHLAVGDRISTSSAQASGPVAALTAMLYERGIPVEMTAFHQLPAGENTATFIRGSDGGHSEWAMGLADDPTQSALRAVIACANRLLAEHFHGLVRGRSPAHMLSRFVGAR